MVLCGISTCFQVLSLFLGQIAHALLTRPPLKNSLALIPDCLALNNECYSVSPLDLHVLSTPPAFVLSQDQTLMFNPYRSASHSPKRSARTAFTLSESDCSFLFFSVSFSRFVAARGAPLKRACIYYQISPRLSTPFSKLFYIIKNTIYTAI